MRKKILTSLLFLLVLSIAVVVWRSAASAEDNPPPPNGCGQSCGKGKVVVCHKVDGPGRSFHDLCVNESALDTHLGHQDSCGPCNGNGK
jgi:hypothetical protein